jgi:hypothetical protein
MNLREVKKYKNFLEEISNQVNIDERDINTWCDIIEMQCFTNSDKIIFREDIERDIERLVDGGIQLASLKEVSEQMGFDIDNSHIFSNSGNIDFGSDESSKSDLLSQITSMWFSHLRQRQQLFGTYYPFKVSKDCSEISCKKYNLFTKPNRIYMYFILASKRGGLSLSEQRKIEFNFEPIAFEAFKKIMPNNAVSYLMGKGKYTNEQFKGNKFKKFKLLSDTLNTGIKVSKDHFRMKDTGENGIDFIGWDKYFDDLPNNHVFTGQATCMKDWSGKEYESSKEALSGILHTSKIGSFTNVLFIPYHFKVGNNWADQTKVDGRKYILFDRFRILKHIDFNKVNNNLLPNGILKAIA